MKKIHRQLLPFILFIVAVVYFAFLWKHMLYWQDGALFAGHPYVWADWSMHLGLVSRFAYMNPSLWLSNNPFFVGARLNYPFGTNLLSGLLIRLGVEFTQAMIIPSFIFSLALVVMLFVFVRQFCKDAKLAIIGSLLFLFSGGLGVFVTLHPSTAIQQLFNSTLTYTQNHDLGIEFTNIWMGMLMPQRAFLLGMPIGLLLFCLVWKIYTKQNIRSGLLLGGGVIAGVLPLIHTHTYIVLVLMSAWLFITSSFKHWKQWLWFGVPATFTSGIVFFFFLRGTITPSSFFSIHLGWMADESIPAWIVFWLKNWGVFGLTALVGTVLLWRKKKHASLSWTCGWWSIFVLANVVQFQPQTWDNSKIFAWVYAGLVIPVMYTIETLIHLKKGGKIIAFLLIVSMCLSGALDVMNMLDFSTHSYQMLSKEEVEVGLFTRDHLPPTAVVLTDDWVANPIPMLSGRTVLLGYPGWVFSYGLSYAQREMDMKDMYEGRDDALSLLHTYHISYVLIGIEEMKDDPNVTFFQDNGTMVFHNSQETLYKLN
ncbi:hypothetical protein C5B42_05925 [Candidatus Cerribacteria bacterium 'Amazon FNV 2010 28 9']|uniref:Glycosyltransferase RgtA/B/C/D-like domain-containing protein n=1 Tax=Candidatus Cerribacteria bacterium 'Amazon FNV 2010 28 9' TaxID=2081795 RepID=A0A317JR36_9BACT|nr:MAG: hypothetical protein C5B42_05925 [Candidatus Cerribacteria bacterium 'Amazon FNV 2010 28 9']